MNKALRAQRAAYGRKGFTLLEVLISAILVAIGVGALGLTVISAKRFLRGAQDKSGAMRLAVNKMDMYLAKSYDGLAPGTEGPTPEGIYTWTVKVAKSSATGTKTIPYKQIEVEVSYAVESGQGNSETKHLYLTNIVSYPTLHTQAITLEADSNAQVPYALEDVTDNELKKIGPSGGEYLEFSDLSYEVKKDILVSYDIAVDITSTKSTQIRSKDTIYTACFYDETAIGAQTRTPIKTQPSFSNPGVLIKGVSAGGSHKIEVRWCYDRPTKDSDGNFVYTKGYGQTTLTLNKAQLRIEATEAE